MSEIYITLAVEDYLSEVVVRKILAQCGTNYQVSKCLCKNGQGYLKSRINNFNKAASQFTPFLVLTDQDSGCPPTIISSWFKHKTSKYLLFRIAVMEIESWILAHRDAFADFFSVPLNRLPQNMDEINNPKQFLINLIRNSRSKRFRTDIVPASGSTAQIGPDYNNHLSQFVVNKWELATAKQHSKSLMRAFERITEFKNNF